MMSVTTREVARIPARSGHRKVTSNKRLQTDREVRHDMLTQTITLTHNSCVQTDEQRELFDSLHASIVGPSESLIHEIEQAPRLNLQPLSLAEVMNSYAKSLGTQKGVIHEDDSLQIGYTTEVKDTKIMVKMFIGNKTTCDTTFSEFDISRYGVELRTEPAQL